MSDLSRFFTHGMSIVIGILLLVIVTVSLLRTVVVPRPLRSNYSDAVTGIVIGSTRLIARIRREYRDRDAVLSWGGPILILALLLSWLLGYLAAYTFLEFGASTDRSLAQAFRQAGSNLLTLGMGGSHDGSITVIDFMAAATGPIVIAMLIAFLPSVYSSYLERERIMVELAIIAGDPIWAPEWLVRAHIADSLDELIANFDAYADWATNLRLTHSTYPVLLHIRSPRFTRHPITTLLAMLDAANLLASLSSKVSHRQVFTMIINGSQAVEVLYVLFFAHRTKRSRIPILGRFLEPPLEASASEGPIPAWQRGLAAVHQASARDAALGMEPWRRGSVNAEAEAEIGVTRPDFDRAVAMMREAGVTIDRDVDQAWTMFRRIRTRYAFPACEIARALTAVPTPWSGPRTGGIATMWPTSVLEVLRSGAPVDPDRAADS